MALVAGLPALVVVASAAGSSPTRGAAKTSSGTTAALTPRRVDTAQSSGRLTVSSSRGAEIEIVGSGFDAGVRVQLGPVAVKQASIQVTSTTITVRLPETLRPGLYPVQVRWPDGEVACATHPLRVEYDTCQLEPIPFEKGFADLEGTWSGAGAIVSHLTPSLGLHLGGKLGAFVAEQGYRYSDDFTSAALYRLNGSLGLFYRTRSVWLGAELMPGLLMPLASAFLLDANAVLSWEVADGLCVLGSAGGGMSVWQAGETSPHWVGELEVGWWL